MITTDLKDILFRVEVEPVYTKGGLFAGYCTYNYNENRVLRLSPNKLTFMTNQQLLAESKELYPSVKWQWAYYNNNKDLFHIIGHLNVVTKGIMICLEAINPFRGMASLNFCLHDLTTKAYIYTNIKAGEGIHIILDIIKWLQFIKIDEPADRVVLKMPYYIKDIYDTLHNGVVFSTMMDMFKCYAQVCKIWAERSFELSRNTIAGELDKHLTRKELV